MKIKCTSPSLNDEQRALLGVSSRFRPDNRLVVGKEYLVLGLRVVIKTPQYGLTTLFQILNDDGQYVGVPAILFEILDGRCSVYWRSDISREGLVSLLPEEFSRDFFAEDFSNGDAETERVFWAVVEKLRTEF